MKFVDLNGIDLILVVLISFFFIRGLLKGFVYQAARIVAIIVGFILARMFCAEVAAFLSATFTSVSKPWDLYLAYILILGASWGALTYLAHLLKKRLEKENLAFLDRLWGGVLGALKACLMIVVAVFALTALPGGGTLAAPLRESKVVPGVYGLMRNLAFAFPEEVLEKGQGLFEMPEEIRPEGGPPPEDPAADSLSTAGPDSAAVETPDDDEGSSP